eukprot:COSAG06_NODE_44750_length_361_cov_0.465649_1_plen_78_part_01
MSELIGALKRKQWEAARALVTAEACREKDEDQRLPLHYALECKAPEDLTREIMAVYPEACREKNEDQMLPLHYALRQQ